MLPELLIKGLPALVSGGLKWLKRDDILEQNATLQALRLAFQEKEAELGRYVQQQNLQQQLNHGAAMETMRQRFSELQRIDNQAHTQQLERARQQFQAQESELQRLTVQENLRTQLAAQRQLQLELKCLDQNFARELKKYDRETGLENLRNQKRMNTSPLVSIAEDLLQGESCLHVFFAPPAVRNDKATADKSPKVVQETHLTTHLREFIGLTRLEERNILFHGGGWQTRAVHSEAGVRSIFTELRSESALVLETFDEGNQYYINVGYWGEGWKDFRYVKFFKFDWKQVLQQFTEARVLDWQKNYSETVLKRLFKADFAQYQANLALLQDASDLRDEGVAEADIQANILAQLQPFKQDWKALERFIEIHHALAVGLLIDEHFLLHAPVAQRRSPMLPRLLDGLLTDYGLLDEQLWLLKAQLSDYYTGLYQRLAFETATAIEDLYLELADTYSALGVAGAAQWALNQSAQTFLAARNINVVVDGEVSGLVFLGEKTALRLLSVSDGDYLGRLAQAVQRLPNANDFKVWQATEIQDWQEKERKRLEKEKREREAKEAAEKEKERKRLEIERLRKEKEEAERRKVEAEANRVFEIEVNKRLAVKLKEFETEKQALEKRLRDEFAKILKEKEAEWKGKTGGTTYPKRFGFEPEMMLIPAGTFDMGSNDGGDNEKPVHKVTLKSFYMCKYAVTFEEYDKYCEATKAAKPSDNGWGRGKRPVINVSWEDAVNYCTWLSRETQKTYRLSTEAEWEYAARGGQSYRYAGSDDLDKVAWHYGNSGSKTHPVGEKQANGYGLHDMSGNVWEWCSDWYGSYSSAAVTNPTGAATGVDRVYRGGSWNDSASLCRVSNRGYNSPTNRLAYLGFRVVLSSLQ